MATKQPYQLKFENQLTTTEREELISYETTIERGKRVWLEVSEALWNIREKRLYRATHATFEAYCKEKHGFSSSRARQLMAGFTLSKSVTIVTLLANEYAIRVANQIPEDIREEVLQQTLNRIGEDQKIKAKDIERTLEIRAIPQPPAPSLSPSPSLIHVIDQGKENHTLQPSPVEGETMDVEDFYQSQVSEDDIPSSPIMGPDATVDRDAHSTPSFLLEAVRNFFGTIDLDPATNLWAQENLVKAEDFYTKEDNGLIKPWFGCVWLNPPYSKGNIDAFVKRAVEAYDTGEVEAILLLTNCAGSPKWYQQALAFSVGLTFPRKRLGFINPATGKPQNNNEYAQTLFYFGRDEGGFAELCRELFWIPIIPDETYKQRGL